VRAIISELASAFEMARKDGWSTCVASLRDVIDQQGKLGVIVMPNGPKRDAISILKPTPSELARPASLSRLHGTSRFPLHTDGAHWPEPPDFVLLELLAGKDSAATTLLPLAKLAHPSPVAEGLDHGVFLVGRGNSAFLATARTRKGLRYDSGCMTSLDGRARTVRDYVARIESHATEHRWAEPGQILVIDNRATIHGRGDASMSRDRVVGRLLLRMGP